jgi:hypothetical protein
MLPVSGLHVLVTMAYLILVCLKLKVTTTFGKHQLSDFAPVRGNALAG